MTVEARRDMGQIWSYIAEDYPSRAASFVERLEARSRQLCRSPLTGPPRDDILPGLRMYVYRTYLIYYRVSSDELTIVRVSPGARDQAALFRED